jgi:PmbA/TldA metallopeptidase C-terminal domain
VLQLSAGAMLGDDELGVWRALTALADARAQRRGLVSAPSGRRDAIPTPSTLTVWSDGSLPYGMRSAPVGEEGEAVRRFKLFSDGAAGEPGMGPRDAARAGRAPNGGVRNLVIAAGATTSDSPLARALQRDEVALLDVRRLRWLQIDPSSGRAEGEIGLAFDPQGKTAYAGGTFAIDLVPALAAAERAPQLVRRGSYQGPAWIRIGPVVLR